MNRTARARKMVYPGRDSTVSLKILIVRRRNKAAVDELDEGLKLYNKGGADNYKKAVARFEKALQIDGTYSQAALYLGRSYNSLFDEQKSEAAFRKAIEIDPDYMEARVSLAGMLLDIGGTDEAIRQLNIVTQREKNNAPALYMQAQAYRMKQLYPQSIDGGRVRRLRSHLHGRRAAHVAGGEPSFERKVSGRLGRIHSVSEAERLR